MLSLEWQLINITLHSLKIFRLGCASAADNRTRLDFHGDKQIWNGALINRHTRGNSALYVYAEVSKHDFYSHVYDDDFVGKWYPFRNRNFEYTCSKVNLCHCSNNCQSSRIPISWAPIRETKIWFEKSGLQEIKGGTVLCKSNANDNQRILRYIGDI